MVYYLQVIIQKHKMHDILITNYATNAWYVDNNIDVTKHGAVINNHATNTIIVVSNDAVQ